MKRVLPKITAAILMATVVTACAGKQDNSEVSGNVEVLAPINDAKSGYSLKFIELSGLDNLREVSGRFVRFFMSPRILGSRLNGSAPQGRFIKNGDGKYVPASDQSQQLVTIYAHMQRLAKLDEEVGAAGVNQWPRDIGVGVRVVGGMDNNAFYDGKTDAMLFVPYTKSDLPIAVNGGILAHEHFHSLFYKLVVKGNAASSDDSENTGSIHSRDSFLRLAGITDDSASSRTRVRIGTEEIPNTAAPTSEDVVRTYYFDTYIRGLNEGLADFWGWMYTGDPDFIATSLPSEKSGRSLNAEETKLAVTSIGQLRSDAGLYNQYDKARFDKYMLGTAYNIGTRYSRVLKRYTDLAATARGVDNVEMRKEVAKMILKTLPLFKVEFQKAKAGGYYAPTQFIESFASVITDMNQKECEFLVGVINNTDADNKRSCQSSGSSVKIVEAQ